MDPCGPSSCSQSWRLVGFLEKCQSQPIGLGSRFYITDRLEATCIEVVEADDDPGGIGVPHPVLLGGGAGSGPQTPNWVQPDGVMLADGPMQSGSRQDVLAVDPRLGSESERHLGQGASSRGQDQSSDDAGGSKRLKTGLEGSDFSQRNVPAPATSASPTEVAMDRAPFSLMHVR